MFGLYPADVVRRAEDSLLQRVPEGSLMHTAARGLAVHVLRLVRDVRGTIVGARAVVLVGSGNNGGDALFAGAYLRERGMAVTAVPVSATWHSDGARALLAAGGDFAPVADIEGVLADADVIVDGIVGIGTRGSLRDDVVTVVERANAAQALRVAVDIPSGIAVDTGSVEGTAFDADATVTFGCFKPGLLLEPGRQKAGAVHIVDIGLRDYLPEPSMRVMDPLDVAELVGRPEFDDHKYRRGVVGIAAGSQDYPGAAVLSVGAARFTGVGMVRFLDRGDGVASRVIDAYPDVVADPRDARADDRVRAWGCGPGFTTADAQTVAMMITEPTPIVLDAGALNCIAARDELQTGVRARAEQGLITVVTPHHGEFVRLFGAETQVRQIAAQWGVIVVRKGPATTITGPDGTVFVDPMGTSDLAYAGSGDVLTGLIAGFLAARPTDDPHEVVAGAVWLHGLCARIAAAGEVPVTAVDIAASVPAAIASVRRGDMSGLAL